MDGAAAGSARSAALDGLRGYAAVAVAFYHSILGAEPALVPSVLHAPLSAQRTLYGALEKLTLSLLNGELAVEIFFVISGVVLFRSLRKLEGVGWQRACLVFAARRFVRIWPPMAAALLGAVAVFAAASRLVPGVAVPTWPELGRNLLLSDYPVIGATWTLHAELAMVPPFLACFLVTRRFGRWALLGCLGYALLAFHARPLLAGDRVLIYALPFAIGGAAVDAGLLDRFYRSRAAGPAALASALAAVALFLVALPAGVRLVLEVACVTVAVGWVARSSGGAVRRLLEARPSLVLGRLSYSFYLWNVPVFVVLLRAAGADLARAHPLEVGLAVGAAATIATIPLAHLSERWIEQPCVALGRRLGRPRGGRERDLLRDPQRRARCHRA